MSSLSDNTSFSSSSTPSTSFLATNSHRESLIFDDSSSLQQLECPICNETMISLRQLNQHLDDLHGDTSVDQKDGILNWFKNAQSTIGKQLSKTTPLAKNKLSSISKDLSQTVISKFSELDVGAVLDEQPDYVTKAHWQKESEHDCCSSAGCDKMLNLKHGRQNCRKCGKLFCDSHCQLQMRLNKQAQHDPVDGLWCRACEDCYQSREGYLDTRGVVRTHTAAFVKARHKGLEKAHLEGNRLEKRLEKLARLYATPAKPVISGNPSLTPPLPTLKHRRRASEQSIVKWEDDASVTNCPICGNSFGKITNRKHHCRLCGRVICEKCSSKVSLNLNNCSSESEQDSVGEVRVCRECRTAVFRHVKISRKEYNDEIAKQPHIVLLYQKLTKIRFAIDATLPKFQDMLDMLQNKEIVNQTHADYQLAARTRKELLENFAQFDSISKKINALPKANDSEKREEKIRQQVAVLVEQKKLVEGYIQEASKKRKIDDVKTLKASLDELEIEINKKKKELGELW
ncbi:6551_t:CDS:10 [Ambispora gerdemannii]|uniref:6551_t:CDS:1 n=1 Tax=Ambispora gerdemannii TaxID=144530 RepID=A0A9N8VKG3_9GLOM|nr:6551_t:CDS:10 [Ambispora gerdemannii]